ncbi:MAG: alcohol dehydrogenase catalytic domain-containing protein [Isosphaeraceae bacterium]
MRGVVCDGSSICLRRDWPEPTPGVGEVRLQVVAAGICATDLQLARGYMNYQGVLGHEFLGQSEDGQRFTAEINNACQVCPMCRAGMQNHCPNRTVLGILGHDGAMADWVCVPERNLHAVPDAIEDRAAVFIEPLAAAFRMVEQVQPTGETRLAVLGDGKLGLLCVWAARLAGAQVSLIGKYPEKLALAGVGVETHTLDDVSGLAHAFDVVVECTGSPTGLPTALTLVRPCGTVVLKTTVAGRHELNLAPIVIDEVRLLGSRCGPFPPAIEALASGRIDVRSLIDAEYALDDAEAAFRAAAEPGARKVILRI